MDDINRRFIETLSDEEKYNFTLELVQEIADTYSKAGNSVCFIIKEEFDYE